MPQDVEPWGFEDITPSVGFMWLAEKKHIAGRVVRYNGTLAHPSAHTDLAHLTVYAFIHFVFGHTNGKLVFADVQGTLFYSSVHWPAVDSINLTQVLRRYLSSRMGRLPMDLHFSIR
jgi:hypothetical protein